MQINIDELYRRLAQSIAPERLLRQESMKRHTSFRIGGSADLLMIPVNKEEIQEAVVACDEMGVPLHIMGNGSNLLVRDKGIRGLVIKIAEGFRDIRVDGHWIEAQAGILLSSLSRVSVQNSLTGLEFASGIPGTLGGAVAMNAGAYGGEMKDVVRSVLVLDDKRQFRELEFDELNFGYRSTVIQQENYIVLSVKMELQPGDYQASKAIVEDLTRKRREKQPLSYPSAGSTFKRPVGYYAGKLIQDAGLRGMRVGDAQISELHAGFIINLGNATAQDVINLIGMVREKIKKDFGVDLQTEVKVVGEE